MKTMKVLALLFMPFVLSITINVAIWLQMPSNLWSENPREAQITFTSLFQTYGSPLWSLIQVMFGLYAVRALGDVRNLYDHRDFVESPLRSTLLIIGLVSLSWFLFMAEGFTNVVVQGISWEEYANLWNESVRRTPTESRLFTLIIGSVTAGIFEEILWRAYGITMLEGKYGTRTALTLQAIAFGVWHIAPQNLIHIVFTSLNGVIYGYVFTKRRRLLTLSAAHWLTDVIGFSFSLFPQ